MNHIFYISNDCLEVFLSDATSTEDDEEEKACSGREQTVVFKQCNPTTTPPSQGLQAIFPVFLLPRVSPRQI